MNKKLKKVQTTYSSAGGYNISINEEVPYKFVSVHQGEPCSGILRHWGKPRELIKELEEIIKALKEI